MNCVLVGQVNEWETNDCSNHAACYEAPKGDMVMEKIDIEGKIILQLFCVCSKKLWKNSKSICIILQKFCICLKNRKLYKVGEKKNCFNALCSLAKVCICSHNAKQVMERIWGWRKNYFNAFAFKMEKI